MSKQDIIRAWKDEEYRNNLGSEEQALLPEHPSGQIELTPEELESADGGSLTPYTWTIPVSVQICYSIYNGGTCPVSTFGCC